MYVTAKQKVNVFEVKYPAIMVSVNRRTEIKKK